MPDNDEILDVICGDRDFWVISATQNIAHVKPAKAGAATNLNLVTASGAIYSFLLNEGGAPNASPDLKVYVAGDEAAPSRTGALLQCGTRRSAGSQTGGGPGGDSFRRAQAVESTAQYRRDYPAKLDVRATARPSTSVRSSSGRCGTTAQFTYIKSDARELPALYEVKDDKPAVVNFQVREGTFVVPEGA